MRRFIHTQSIAGTRYRICLAVFAAVSLVTTHLLHAEEPLIIHPSLLVLPLHTNQVSRSESRQWENDIVTGLRAALSDRFEVYRPSRNASSWTEPNNTKPTIPDAVDLLLEAGAAFGIFGSISKIGDEQFFGYLVLLDATELEPLRFTTINVQGRDALRERLDAETDTIITVFERTSLKTVGETASFRKVSTENERNDAMKIEFSTTPAGAAVYLNGSRICETTPCTRPLHPGRHSLLFRLDEHDENDVQIDLQPKSPIRRLHARLQPQLGALRINTSPADVHVSVIGHPHDSKAWRRGVQLPSGSQQIQIDDDCFVPELIEVNIAPRIETVVDVIARPEFAFLRVRAQDSRGKVANARVFVDDTEIGPTGGVLQVPACIDQAAIDFEGSRYAIRFAKLKAGTMTEIKHTVGIQSIWQQASTGISWIRIPGGSFQFGCEAHDPDCSIEEDTAQKINVAGFWLMETEAAVATYERCRQAGHCKNGSRDNPGLPVTAVSLQDAQDFCQWAGARVPSPTEWEYAAKSGQSNVYPWGNAIPDRKKANCRGCDDAFDGLSPVGSFPAGNTRWGVKDMAGNVWEWTLDNHDGTQAQARGGSWNFHPHSLRNAAFVSVPVGSRRDDLGIRCLRDAAAE